MSHSTIPIAGVATVVAALTLAPAGAATATGPRACVGGHCFTSLAAAVAHAGDGDVVTLGPGTFAGGVTIARSIRLVGAGQGATAIKGGHPVLTVPSLGEVPPSVSISGLTVTGGVNTGTDGGGRPTGYNADGGGILVPFSPGGEAGAALTLSQVTVTGNKTMPSSTYPSPSGAQCPGGDCPYAGSQGGGIWTAGPITLDHVTVSDNLSGGRASDTGGAGVFSVIGPVRISSSQIVRNTAAPTPHTIGRWAEGGGLTIVDGSKPTTISRSSISGNVASLVTDWPVTTDGQPVDDQSSNLVKMAAQAAGIFMEGNTQLTLTDSAVDRNRVVAVDPEGEPFVYAAALHYQYGGDGLRMANTTINDNTLVADIATSQEYAPVGGLFETDGHAVLHHVTVAGNVQALHTTSGPAILGGAVTLCGCANGDGGVTDLSHVVVSHNTATATSDKGAAQVWGGGIFAVDGTRLTLSASLVSDNRAIARAVADPAAATVYGGGVWVGPAWGSDPVVDLGGSAITRNIGLVSHGGTVHGGGLYATVPVTGTSGVTNNLPNNIEAP